MTTALFIGRFQPFHKGHLSAIKEILGENDKIIIAIGSSQESNTPKNPFSSAERKQMIQKAMDEFLITNYEIIEVPDAENDESWIEKVKEKAKFDSVYTSGNIWTRKCFQDSGFEVKTTTFIPPYKGELIREKILNKEFWEDLVPNSVYLYIKEINGEQRIKNLYTTEK